MLGLVVYSHFELRLYNMQTIRKASIVPQNIYNKINFSPSKEPARDAQLHGTSPIQQHGCKNIACSQGQLHVPTCG